MKKNKRTQVVTAFLFLFFTVLFLIITARFLYIQVSGKVGDVDLKKWAEEKRTASYEIPAERGRIFDKTGNALAYDQPTYRLYANVDQEHPNRVKNVKKAAKQLAPIIELEEKELRKRLEKGLNDKKTKQLEFGSYGRKLSEKQKDKIQALEISGIHLAKESIRYYPNGNFASHVIGFAKQETSKKNAFETVMQGTTGVEKVMDEQLTGKKGYISYERDLFNKKLVDPNEVVQKPIHGDHIYLTIDQKIQTLLEDVLSEADLIYEPKRMTAIVMNPKTGEILALSNRPSFNPNKPVGVKNWYNDAISSPFEPGSTMKMFTWAAAIEEGVYNGTEGYKSGRYRINERIQPVPDHNGGKGWGTISYDEGFQRSSNVATAKLVWEKLGTEKFLDYLKAFDFDKETGIDLPGEVAGKILYNWPLEKVTTGFGQGSTLTPMQQMKAATAIANEGKMMKPYIIDKVVDPNTNKVKAKTKPEVVGEPISKETAQQVLQLLESVVYGKHGTGKAYQMENYKVAGKTGTAQIPNPNGGGYLTGYGNHIYSFLGMVPADDPELIMYISMKQPNLKNEDGHYESGSAPLAFVFKNVIENSLHYLNVEPNQEVEKETKSVKLPDLVGKSVKDVLKLEKDIGLKISVIGEGKKVLSSNLMKNTEVYSGDHLIIVTDQTVMPNIIGWSFRDVLQLANLLHLDIETKGNGYVISQSIPEGKTLTKKEKLKVELQPPLKKKK
ncbi:penicillin-binding protein 2B [Cerasibacillus quisquiliarum]|uniref:serine-type D-Ala-D-Ala carboxypeptidase n=1 Tax=Cerasibacillus quisquiliarum TaxID=227865 RepID=A0A511UX53_9BACI|nr:penicillin-binding protein [Cerasibacillus quisquiliarum]MBB5145767.1 penicillin-binding protein 2B [Cerasibacillus quisquiliarum]GEN30338.1 dihydropteridine reductase [Cerasibacillus quisquiliarum]